MWEYSASITAIKEGIRNTLILPPLTRMMLVTNLLKKLFKKEWNPGTLVLMWGHSASITAIKEGIRNTFIRPPLTLMLLVTTVPTFNFYTKCVGSPGKIHDRTSDFHPFFLGIDTCMTSQLNVALICQLCGPLMCLAYFLDMSCMVVCTTSHWQTSSRWVQELNVCTVICSTYKMMQKT